MIDTFIFDLEGVIVDTEPLWDSSNRLFLQAHGFTYDRATIKPLIAGRSLFEGTKIIKETLPLSGELDALVAQRKSIIEQQLQAGAVFIPGFIQFYSSIKDSFKSCVATSMDAGLLAILDRQFSLSTLFRGNLFSIADIGNISKPDPALFLYAARRLDSSPERCVVIEDSPHGVQAAKNAGMRCIALTSTFDAKVLSDADLIVSSFQEINLK